MAENTLSVFNAFDLRSSGSGIGYWGNVDY